MSGSFPPKVLCPCAPHSGQVFVEHLPWARQCLAFGDIANRRAATAHSFYSQLQPLPIFFSLQVPKHSSPLCGESGYSRSHTERESPDVRPSCLAYFTEQKISSRFIYIVPRIRMLSPLFLCSSHFQTSRV